MNRPIGVFDSGLGGISVLRDAVRLLPQEHFIFCGDNRNAPYGVKTPEQIHACVMNVVEGLLRQDIKALLIACNTATAASAQLLRQQLNIPVIGMEPALKPAHENRRDGQILVLATPATLHMEKFRNLMQQYGEGAVPVEGYGIVECVESGHIEDEIMLDVLHGLMDKHLQRKTDGIVLGCTHYSFIKNALSVVAPGVPLFDGNLGTVRQLRRVLESRGLLRNEAEEGSVTLTTTGDASVILPRMNMLMNL